MLPFDVASCHPITIDLWCKNCARWTQHPDQTWGVNTTQIVVESSQDDECRYVRIDEQEPQE